MESVEAWRLTGDLPVEHGKADPFAAAIRATRMSVVIGDACRPDHPVLFANEVDHRVKNNLQMISALIDTQGRNIADPAIRLPLLDAGVY